MKNKTDTKFMKEALALAVKSEGLTSPNPLVGAVIVKGNKIIGKGYHKKAGSPHAEIVAIKSARGKTNGSTLYINLEPCTHYGRTPPCAPEIIKAGIKRVVIAMPDPNPLVNGKGIKKLKSEGIDVQVGILEQDAGKLNETYIKYITKKMPFIVLKWAMSLDGKIATRTGDSKWISHEASRRFAHKLRGEFDAVLIGIETLLKDNPCLTTHNLGVKEPKKIVVDSRGRIPLNCNLLKINKDSVIVATTNKISKEKIKGLNRRGAEIIVTSSKNDKVNIKELMIELAKPARFNAKQAGGMEITSVLVEGGGNIIASFLEEKLADKFIAFISPIIIGGKDTISPVEGKGIEKIADAISVRDFSSKKIGEDIVVEGYL
jgi:diaminohydroxyphosphoribosylaminopyrimidine deaminase/5-amino-6-(5-phosphoribosylamino)uracil reductase